MNAFRGNWATALFSTVLIISLTGCAVRPVRQYTPIQSQIKEEASQNYQIGVQQTAYVGNEIIVKSNLKFREQSASNFIALANYGEIQTGSIYQPKYIDLEDNGLFIGGYNPRALNGGLLIKVNKNGEIIDNSFYYWNLGGLQKHLEKVNAPVSKLFEPQKEKKIIEEGSFRYQLVYSGMDNNNVKISYREYKDDFARPAFNQELVYNLDQSKTIRYKNFRIRIENATNEEITYTVLED